MQSAGSASYRYKVRWENVAVIGVAAAMLAFFLPQVGRLAESWNSPAVSAGAKAGADPARMDRADAGAAESQMSVGDAKLQVAAAMKEARQGRFDGAEKMLATIPDEIAESSGALAAVDTISDSRADYETLADSITLAVHESRWDEAHSGLRQIARIAPLTVPLKRMRSRTMRQLAASASYRRVTAMMKAGRNQAALSEAQRALARYGEPRMRTLVTRLSRLTATTATSAARPSVARTTPRAPSGPPTTAPPSVTGGGPSTMPKPSLGTIAPAPGATPSGDGHAHHH